MLRKKDRFKLHFGPYRTPRFKYGSVVQDEIRGEVTIVALKDAQIPWPFGVRRKGRTLVMSGDLARAVRRESVVAVSYWWGVCVSSVRAWRRKLGVPSINEGTHRLQVKYGYTPATKCKLRKAVLMANNPDHHAKISAALKGRKRLEQVSRAVIAAHTGRPRSEETRRKMSQTCKRLGILPPLAVGRLWSAREDELLRTLSVAEVARKTGRTHKAVYHRRQLLKLTNRRRRRGHRPPGEDRKPRSN